MRYRDNEDFKDGVKEGILWACRMNQLFIGEHGNGLWQDMEGSELKYDLEQFTKYMLREKCGKEGLEVLKTFDSDVEVIERARLLELER